MRHSAAFRVAPSLHLLRCMGAVENLVGDYTCETVHSRPVRPARAKRVEGRTPFDFDDNIDDTLDTAPDSSSDFDDDYTDPDPFPDIAPSWAPPDFGHSLIAEWDASADARAARPILIAHVLRATAEDTAITSVEKPAIRSAS